MLHRKALQTLKLYSSIASHSGCRRNRTIVNGVLERITPANISLESCVAPKNERPSTLLAPEHRVEIGEIVVNTEHPEVHAKFPRHTTSFSLVIDLTRYRIAIELRDFEELRP